MWRAIAAILGGASGALVLVLLSIFITRFCLIRRLKFSRASGTGSDDQSTQVGSNSAMELLPIREARRFDLEELSLATQGFNDKSLVGVGKFGEVFKGLLRDGTLVAIKKRPGAPSQNFMNKARYLSSIHHRNLVTLLGYCQERNMQFLVYEYVAHGSVSNHLYGNFQIPNGNLEFKHRLSIALGAAKGLAHLHSLSPRLVHKDFKTQNVLIDESFTAKVSDAGLQNFLGRADAAGPSSRAATDQAFLAPEVSEFRRSSEKSDIYSFGVFLLEMISGKEASKLASSGSSHNLFELAQNGEEPGELSGIVDHRFGNTFWDQGMEELIRLALRCLDRSSEGRPPMSRIVKELERLLEKEAKLLRVAGQGTPKVTLGSQLF